MDEPLIKESSEDPSKKETTILGMRLITWIRILVILAVIAAVIVGVLVFRVQNYIPNALEWVKKQGFKGAFVFIGIYIIATICFIPGSLLTLGAGFIFRPLYYAIIVVWVGASIGCFCSFLLGRYALRSWVAEKAKDYPKFYAVDQAVRQEGWKIVLLLRLSPVIPFNFLNYALATTNVPFLHYALASSFGMLPGTCLYVYIGSLAGNLTDIATHRVGPDYRIQIAIWVVSGVVIVAVVVFVTIIARRAIQKALTEQAQKSY